MAFIEDTEVLRVLRGLNPWWSTGSVPASLAPPIRRLAFDEVMRWLERADVHRAVVLSGARRVGKTTLLYQVAQAFLHRGVHPARVLYVSFDHPILKLTPLERIIEIFVNNVAGEERELVVLLDEIHYAGDWSLWLKRLVDQRAGMRIAATGSASVDLETGAVESGVGRVVEVRIPTLSFYEYVELRRLGTPSLEADVRLARLPDLSPAGRTHVLARLSHLEPHFHRYLLVGGFPETAQLDDLALAQRLLRDDVVDRVLKRDMTALYNVRNVLDLERLFIYLCLHSGGIVVQEKLAQDLGVSRTTVANDLRYLEMANLIYRLDPVRLTGKKVLRPRSKIYLADSALRNAVLLRGEEVLADAAEMGLIVETAVLKHLSGFIGPERPEIGYWRGDRDQEVDFVLRWPGGWEVAAEVKYRSQVRLGRKDGIYAYAEGSRPALGLVITKSPDDFGPGAEQPGGFCPFQVPAFVLLYLLGYAERHGLGWGRP